MQEAKTKVRVTPLSSLSKADESLLHSNAMVVEDEFLGAYYSSENPEGLLIAPPYSPYTLKALPYNNNTLLQCISAYSDNIDGTGFYFSKKGEQGREDDAVTEQLEAFFDEPFPQMSWLAMRDLLRRDQESCGYAFLEVIRNLEGKIMLLRPIQAETMRLARLGKPREVKVTLSRFGKEIQIPLMLQLRIFAQNVNNRLVYFKPFGAQEDLDKTCGRWGPCTPDVKATEVIMFGVHPDAGTPYFVPRWINQLPSVLGSRKAEELNLEFFNSGGLPPVLMFLQGGAVADDVRQQLEKQFDAANRSRRAALIEIYSTGGSLDKDSKPEIKVERFGDESTKDSLFDNYDTRCEERIRRSFRLPPLFTGAAEAYSFATAMISYLIAEEQIFRPERHEFDSIITNTLLKEMAPEYEFHSNPLSLKDIQTRIQALTLLGSTGVVAAEDFVRAVNETSGLSMKVLDGMEQTPVSTSTKTPSVPSGSSETPPELKAEAVQKSDKVLHLAESYLDAIEGDYSDLGDLLESIEELSAPERLLFDTEVATQLLGFTPSEEMGDMLANLPSHRLGHSDGE